MNMYKYMYIEGGGKCVYMVKYTYAGIRKIRIQIKRQDRHITRVMCTHV